MIVTRFAPSPTGFLHLGHAASALFAFEQAQASGGRFLVRLEDIDPVRCRAAYAEAILDDLHWLGLSWEEPVRSQMAHLTDYTNALDRLRVSGLIYPCFCTRREVETEASTSVHAPHLVDTGGAGPLYPGTCRGLSPEQRAEKGKDRPCVWRLDVRRAVQLTGPLHWKDEGRGAFEANPARFGDVVLARKDVPTSYHLSCVVDDALQGVTLVTRGEDLLPVTDVQVLLQKLLGLPTPSYYHHPLKVDPQGRRYAKRDKAITLRSLREAGCSVDQVRAMARFTF